MSRLFLERTPKRHLVLHMDINKTIIQFDGAGGRTMEDVLNSNAAANVYGYVDAAGQWQALYSTHERERCSQQQQRLPQSPDGQEVITYDTYIDQKHCEPPGMQDLPTAERDAVWKEVSGQRRAASRKFTFAQEPGAAYASLVEEQRRALLKVPSSSSSSSAAAAAGSGGEYHSIIPSFFTLMNTISELDWPFTLIFRTFGSDLAAVLTEWRQFVMGEHVCKPKGQALQRMKEHYVEPLTGCVFRDTRRMLLCYGPSVSASQLPAAELQGDDAAVTAALKKLPGFRSVTEVDMSHLSSTLLQYYAQSNGVGGLVDYYPCWAQAAERRSGGKVFAVPMKSSSSEKHPQLAPIQVFFDDNIFLNDEFSIVDLRDANTGKSVMGVDEEKPFCVPVNAYKAIVENDYFLDELCERIRLQTEL